MIIQGKLSFLLLVQEDKQQQVDVYVSHLTIYVFFNYSHYCAFVRPFWDVLFFFKTSLTPLFSTLFIYIQIVILGLTDCPALSDAALTHFAVLLIDRYSYLENDRHNTCEPLIAAGWWHMTKQNVIFSIYRTVRQRRLFSRLHVHASLTFLKKAPYNPSGSWPSTWKILMLCFWTVEVRHQKAWVWHSSCSNTTDGRLCLSSSFLSGLYEGVKSRSLFHYNLKTKIFALIRREQRTDLNKFNLASLDQLTVCEGMSVDLYMSGQTQLLIQWWDRGHSCEMTSRKKR